MKELFKNLLCKLIGHKKSGFAGHQYCSRCFNNYIAPPICYTDDDHNLINYGGYFWCDNCQKYLGRR